MDQNTDNTTAKVSSSSSNGVIGGGLFFMNQILLAYRLGFQTLRKTILNMREQVAANFSKEEEHYVYKQIDIMLRHGSDNPNLHSIVKSLEQITFYSNQAEALFKFFAKDLKLPIVYGFQPFSQKENYPIDQSTRMGCVSLNNFKIQCVEQPGLNKIRGYISHIFTILFGERVVGAQKKEEQSASRNLFSLDGIASLLTSFGSAHTFGLLGVSLLPSVSGDSDRKILKSRGIVCTSQFKRYHEFYMTKSMLSKLKLEDKKIIGFKQTFLFGTMWEFYRKYIYRNEPFKNHGIYTISYHPFFELVMKLVTEKNVKYVRNNRNMWQLKNFPLGNLKIKSCREVEFQTTAVREDVEGLKTFIKLFGSQNVEVIEPYRHYLWDFSKMIAPGTLLPPKLRVICRDRSEICETNRVYGLSRMVLEVESLDQVQYQLSSNKINFKLETDTIIIKHPLLPNIQINLVE